MEILITKQNGSREPFNADRINRSIERASKGLMDPISIVTQVATETKLTLYDGITTDEIDQATINANVSVCINFSVNSKARTYQACSGSRYWRTGFGF